MVPRRFAGLGGRAADRQAGEQQDHRDEGGGRAGEDTGRHGEQKHPGDHK